MLDTDTLVPTDIVFAFAAGMLACKKPSEVEAWFSDTFGPPIDATVRVHIAYDKSVSSSERVPKRRLDGEEESPSKRVRFSATERRAFQVTLGSPSPSFDGSAFETLGRLPLPPTPSSVNSPPQAILSKAWTEEDYLESMQEERDVVRLLVPPAVDPMTLEDLEVAAPLIPEEDFTWASSTAEELEVEELLMLPTLSPVALEELEVARLLNAGGVVLKFDTDTKYRLVSLPQPTLAARLAHHGRAAREVVGAVVTLANQEVKEFKRTAFPADDSIKLLEIPLAFYAGFLSTYKREDTPPSTPVTTLEIPPVAVVLPRLPIRRFYSIEPAPSLFKRTSYFRQLKTL
ncbi:hypothetical protein C8R46DRAFT_1192736 [Mycena filopes]|nr:hypothetical protein C8R46DRAFT_1192736 [Mycena filopes]